MSLKALSKTYNNFRDSALQFFGDLPVTAFKIVDCIFCKNSTHQTVFTLDSLWIVRCQCGFVYNRRQPKEETLESFYSNSDPMQKWASLKQSPFELSRQKEKFGKAVEFLMKQKIKSLCDLGCGAGAFLKIYREQDQEIELTGVDPHKQSLEHARGEGISTVQATIENYLISHQQHKTFEAVSLFGVLEHLPDPIYTLNRIKNIMKPNGYLVVCVPNVNSRAVRALWEECFTFCPQHLWYYSINTLKTLFQYVGLTFKEYYTIEPEELPVMKKSWGFKPYELVPTWAEKKYFTGETRKLIAGQILAANEGYKIVAVAQKK